MTRSSPRSTYASPLTCCNLIAHPVGALFPTAPQFLFSHPQVAQRDVASQKTGRLGLVTFHIAREQDGIAIGIINQRETHAVGEDERRSVALIAIADEFRILRLDRGLALQVVFEDPPRLLRS